jgi:hypothetical protein
MQKSFVFGKVWELTFEWKWQKLLSGNIETMFGLGMEGKMDKLLFVTILNNTYFMFK